MTVVGVDLGHALRDAALTLGWWLVAGWPWAPIIVLWGALWWEMSNAAVKHDPPWAGGWFGWLKSWTREETGDMIGSLIGVSAASAAVMTLL